MPALHQGFGATAGGTFRPLQTGPNQAHHLPEAPIPWPQKSVQSHTPGIPHAASHDSRAQLAIYVHQVSGYKIMAFVMLDPFTSRIPYMGHLM